MIIIWDEEYEEIMNDDAVNEIERFVRCRMYGWTADRLCSQDFCDV